MAKQAVAEIVNVAMTEATEPPEPSLPLYRELPPAQPFPIDALGDLLARTARAIHQITLAPQAMCAQSVLSAASLAVQPHADIVLPMGHVRPLSLFVVTVAASGERKTAVDTEALRPVRMREEVLYEEYEHLLAEYDNAYLAWSKARDQAINSRKNKGKDAIKTALDQLGPAPDAPLFPLLAVTEPNYPGLTKAFDIGWPSLGLFSDEGGGFVGGHGMSKDHRLRTVTGLSDLWEAKSIDRVRAGDGVRVLPGRRLAMHLMMQPGVADGLLGDSMIQDQGLLSRCLIAAPDSTTGTRFWREPPPEAQQAMAAYTDRMLEILEMPLPLKPGARNVLQPRWLQLSPEARALWIESHDMIEGKLGAGAPFEPIIAFANKAPQHAARIAGVLAMFEDPEVTEIAERHMAAGFGIVEFYLEEALRLVGATTVPAKLKRANLLLKWLRTRWPEPVISLPDIYQYGPQSIRNKAEARKAVDVLVDHGALVSAGPCVIRGKRRRDTWRLVGG